MAASNSPRNWEEELDLLYMILSMILYCIIHIFFKIILCYVMLFDIKYYIVLYCIPIEQRCFTI